MRDNAPAMFVRKDDDDAWDKRLPCERGPDCHDPLCPSKLNRDAMRVALGSMVEALEAIAMVQSLAQDYWGGCADPECTFEARMQEHFSHAGKATSRGFMHLLDGIHLWRSLPDTWAEPEELASVRAVLMLRALNHEALRQVKARQAGSPDPRDPYHTDREPTTPPN